MTDHEREPSPEPEVPKDAAEDQGPKGLRKTIDEQNRELEKLRSKERERAMTDAGFDPTMDKVVRRDIERGDYGGELDAESLQTYATEEYAWTPSTEQSPAAPPAPDLSAEERARQSSQSALASAREESAPAPIEPTSEDHHGRAANLLTEARAKHNPDYKPAPGEDITASRDELVKESITETLYGAEKRRASH